MVNAETFVDGTSVKWQLLATTIVGGTFLAFFEGLMGTVLAFARAVGDLWTGLGEFLATLVDTWLGAPTETLITAYSALETAIGSTGFFGYVLGAAAIALLLYAVAQGVDYYAGN